MPFQIQTQRHDQWCWAAVSASVGQYFSPFSEWTQCSIAREVLKRDCCNPAIACNKPAYLEDALGDRVLKKLRRVQGGPLSFPETLAEIQQGLPIGVRIGWFEGGGHFVVIRGCREGAGVQLLSIADPWFVDSIQYFEDFTSGYLGRGEWTDTFLLKSV